MENIELPIVDVDLSEHTKPLIDEGYESLPSVKVPDGQVIEVLEPKNEHEKGKHEFGWKEVSVDDYEIDISERIAAERISVARTNSSDTSSQSTAPLRRWDNMLLTEDTVTLASTEEPQNFQVKAPPGWQSKIPKPAKWLNPLKQFLNKEKEKHETQPDLLTRLMSKRVSPSNPIPLPQQDDKVSLERKRFDSKYKIMHQLGTGGHASVKLATTKTNSGRKQVVCKFITAQNVWHWTPEKLPLEIEMMKELTAKGHESIIQFIEYFDLDLEYIIVMEYLGKEWMDLYDYIELFGPVREDHAREIFERVVDVVEYIHNLGYSHNDIKGI